MAKDATQPKVRSIYIHPNKVAGLLHHDGKLIHHTDWGNGVSKPISAVYSNLPSHWADEGVDAMYVWPDWVAGFLKGNLIYHSDWNNGIPKSIGEVFPTMPSDWK